MKKVSGACRIRTANSSCKDDMLAFTSHTPKNNLDSLIYSYMLINTLLRDSTIVKLLEHI